MSNTLKKINKKIAYSFVFILALLSAYLVHAQFSGDTVVVKTVNVFPAEIDAEGWSNAETLTFQNLGEYALLQDFNSINSATLRNSNSVKSGLVNEENQTRNSNTLNEINASSSVTEDGVTEDNASTSENPTSTSSDSFDETVPAEASPETVSSSSSDNSFDTQTTSSPATVPLPDEAREVGQTDQESDTSAESGEPSATTTVLRRVENLFRLAIDSVAEAITGSSSSDSNSSESIATGTVSEEADESQPDNQATETDSVTDVTSEGSTDNGSTTTDSNQVNVNWGLTTTTENSSVNTPLASSTEVSTSGQVSTDTTNNPDTTLSAEEIESNHDAEVESGVGIACIDDCVPYVIKLKNFGFPIDEGVEIGGAQLRVSMAAKKKNTRERIPAIEIRYSTDSGQSWSGGGTVLIEDEISNSINGGYFLFSLPDISSEAELSALQVQIVYQDNPDILADLFVESAWLELFTLEMENEQLSTTIAELLADNGYNPDILTGDKLTLPNGEVIYFEFTDDNTDETLIIKSDRQTYQGLSEVTTYFSVTNSSNRADDINIQAYFPDALGEVKDIQILNPNKPKEVVIPEYRPYVYHCEAGWEYEGEFTPGTLDDLSKQLSVPSPADVEMTTPEENDEPNPNQSDLSATSSSIDFGLPSSTTPTNEVDFEIGDINTTTVMLLVPNAETLLQLVVDESISNQSDTGTSSDTSFSSTSTTEIEPGLNNTEIAQTEEGGVTEDEGTVEGYSCRNTNVVRECDVVEGAGTACRVNRVLVEEHQVTQYVPGWEPKEIAEGEMPKPGFLRRAAEFIGFGPDRKEVPESFEVKAHTPNEYKIESGETLYFKMQIEFSPRSSGEYWIEAIGDREYGLLDPFWQSSWRKRLPITIDNTGNASSSEQQVFISLDNATSSFWTNVKEDGGDIRFVQESGGNSSSWYDNSWSERLPITIQASAIDEELTGFPVYVDLSTLGDDFWSGVKSDGSDIRITSSNGLSELAYSLPSFDDGSETGELYFKADSIASTTDTTFYIYYANASASGYTATDTYGSEAVWSNGYLAVYHFNDDPGATAPQLIDQTSNGYDATTAGMTSGNQTVGYVGDGYEFDGVNEYVFSSSAGTGGLDGLSAYSISFWSEADDIGSDIPFYGLNTDNFGNNNDDRNAARIDPSGANSGASNLYKIGIYTTSGSIAGETTGGRTTTAWTHFGITWNSGSTPVVYQDGSATGYDSNGGDPGTLAGTVIADVLAMGRGNKDEWFDGKIDEFRVHDVAREAAWVAAEHSNQSSATTFYATSSSQTLTEPSFSELDHWVQHFSTTTKTADVWVQLDTLEANASTTIYLYYDNPVAESTSDEYAPFTYSDPRNLYYIVNDSQSNPIVVYSLIDNNDVSIDGNTPVTLQSGETTSFGSYSSTSVIAAHGPITARTSDDASEPPVPISFASTSQIVSTNRNNEDFYVLSPFATADVQVFAGSSITPSDSSTVTALGTDTYNVNLGGTDGGIVEADEPILLYHNNDTDSYVAYPPTTRDLYGVHSNFWRVTPLAGSTDVDVYCSGGATGTITAIGRGELAGDSICTSGNQGAGDAVRIANPTNPIGATQEADGDGNESSRFLPTPEFGTRYIVPQAAEYVSIVCAPRFGSTTIEVQTAAGITLDSGSCAPSGDLPGLLNMNLVSPYAAGSQIVSTDNVPFYMYYEYDGTGDETNTWSAVQAKQFRALDLTSELGDEETNTEAQYTQNNFAWYQNIDAETPITRWSLGDTDAVEGESIIDGGAVNPGDELRLRINLEANNGTGTIGSSAFTLQYTEITAEQCQFVSEAAWVTVPGAGSTTAAFTGFNNAGVNDGATLPSSLLSDTTVLGSYEEENFSSTLPNQVDDGNFVEFDWVLKAEDPSVNSNYCFRIVRSTSQELTSYTVYPNVETAGPPGVPSLFTPFDNEHASTTDPYFEFSASDIAGDDIDYQIQVSTDVAFGSTIIDRQSDVNLFDFENLQTPSDKAPFNSAQRVRFTPPSSLSNGTTYWWRVRAADPDGSDSFGIWSNPQSFTVNTAVSVTEWHQTTDEQFQTGTLDNARVSGSDSVELDLAGSNLIGEYGTVALTNGATSSVSLNNSYTDPVVVASIRYPRSITSPNQPALRVFNKTSGGFDIIADNFSNDSTGTSTADYVVMEAGDWLIDDGDEGVRVFATSTSATGAAGNGIPSDPPQAVDITFPSSFSDAPAVFTMVTTKDDPQWVVSSVYDGTNIQNPPTDTQVSVYLNDNLDSNDHGTDDIDVIAFDVVNDVYNGTNNGVVFDAQTTAADVTDTPNTKSFSTAFGSIPGLTLVQQLTMFGVNGGYAQVDLDNPVTASDITVSIEEGGSGADRGHAAESVAILAFEDSSGDILRAGTAQYISTPVDFDDVKLGNAWGEVRFNDSGDVVVKVQYQTGSGFQNIPDSALAGNSSGFTSGPINILDLDTTIYNELRLVADFSGIDPELFDITVAWGQRVEVPALGDPFDNEKVDIITPTFDFTTSDPQNDDLQYEVSISTDPAFIGASTTANSLASSSDFSNLTTPADTNPFNSGDTVTYTVPAGSALSDGETYWWRVRAKDPSGADAYSPWSNPDSFTVDTSVTVSTWHQTTQAQFEEGMLDGTLASSSDSVAVPPDIGEYGSTTVSDHTWQTVTTDLTYDEMVVVASAKYSFNGSDNGRTVQVRNKTSNSFEIKAENYTESLSGPTDINYIVIESGDWEVDDGGTGTRILAGTAADVSAVNGRGVTYTLGTQISFSPNFTDPGALTTVSSANGAEWVHSRVDNGTQASEVAPGGMYVSLGVSLDSSKSRVPEDVDYLVFETSTGTNNGVLFDAFNTGEVVTESETESTVNFNQTFVSAPQTIIVQNNGMEGGDGGSALQDTDGVTDATEVSLSIAEHGSTAGNHTTEVVSVFALADAAGTIQRVDGGSGGLTGTIRSEVIDFFDGNGPRFEQFYWSDTTPGTSDLRLQVEYFDGNNWNLVPDDDWYNVSWTRRVPITLQSSQIEEDLTDFPVYVDLGELGSLFWDNVLGTGADIRITESDGATEVPFDLTYIDAGSDEGELHFKADLASTTNQTFYVYFGNAAASAYATDDPFGAENVWTNNYDARHQLGENPTASAPQFTDSTGNGYTATARAGMSAGDVVAGQVGRAIDLDGDDGGSFDTDFAYSGPFTASMWWNSSGDGFAISIDAGADEKIGPWTSGNIFTRVVSGSDNATVPSPADGSWHYIVLQRDASNKVDVYVDGVQTRMFSDVAQPGVSDWENFGGQATQGFVGLLDELRFATGTRSLGWLDTEYNNQSNTGAFYTVGTVQQSSGDTLIGNNAGFTGGGPIDISGLDANVYSTIRLLATLECGGSDCPTLDDWSVEWGEGVLMSGTLKATDRVTNVASGTIRVAVNGVLQPGTGTVSNGNWSIGNVTAFSGDVITVYVEGATDANRAATSFVYNGAGNMTGVAMYETYLTLAGDNSELLTNALLASYDNDVAGDTDVFFNVTGANELVVCAVASCDDFSLYITEDIAYRPSDTSAGDIDTHSFLNEGDFQLDDNTMRVSGSWDNQATSSLGNGEIVFTATAGTHIVTDHTDQLSFPTLTFGEGSGTATWELLHPLTVTNDWTVSYGTVDRFSANQIAVSGDISIGSGGVLQGAGTTTFAGTGESNWSDVSSGQNLGNVVINGNTKTVSITSNVYANDILIGADDTLQGGSGNVIHVGGDFTNSGTFTPNTSTVELVDDERGRQTPGVQPLPWYDTNWSSRYPVTIQASEIDDDLSDFPVSVDLADFPAAFWGEVKNNGGDIRVTAADATTEVAREVFGVNTTSEVGELHFKAPTLSSTTDTTFYVYFGNVAATDYAVTATYGAEAVWSNGYVIVSHQADETTTTLVNSADGGADGTKVGVNNPTESASGKLGVAQDFLNAGDIQYPNVGNNATEITISAWFNADDLSGSGDTNTYGYTLFSAQSSAQDGGNYTWLTAGGTGGGGSIDEVRFCPFESSVTCDVASGSNLSTGNWHHVSAMAIDGGAADVRVDGSSVLTTTSNGGGTWNSESTIGDLRRGRDIPFDGRIDELRISSTTRSTAWRDAEYRNVATTTDFYTIGNAEGAIGFSVAAPTPHEVTTGGANLYRFTMNDAVTSASFIESSLVVQNNFSIATGTVNLPTTLLSVGGNFSNTGGDFAHNNSEVRFTGGGTKTIEKRGTEFLNAFYNVAFTGNGNWSYLDTNATTTNTYTISNGSVTFPSGSLTVGDDFVVSGSGSFNANSGEVVFLVEGEPANVTPRTSTFADVRIRDIGGSSWFDSDFGRRLPITISASEIDDDLADFPVFIDLSFMGNGFFDYVANDGADIRVTESDGLTQVPVEVVSIDTGTKMGELHFRATTLSSSTDSIFYLYFDNPDADPVGDGASFGSNNVWSNGYEAVYHLPTTVDSTGNGYTITASNIGNSSSAMMGEAADFNGSNSVYTYGDPEAVLDGFSEFTLSMWYESDVIDTDKGLFMASAITGGDDGICARYDTAGANAAGDDVFKGCLETTSGGNQQWESTELVQTTDYQYYVQTWQAGSVQDIYFDAVVDTFTDPATSQSGTTNVAAGTMYIGAGAKDTASGGWDGRIDEVRIASAFRSAEWVSTEYANQSDAANFIATSTIEQSSRRIFTNANVTATGDMVVESGLVDLPTGIFTVGGSFDNNAMFNSRNGTVRFTAATSSVDVAAGNSSFSTLEFAGATGDFTVSENATATNAINISAADEFTLSSGLTLTTLGTFSSSHSAGTTTWTGSTLRLAGVQDYAINDKTNGADTYGTLSLADGVNVSLWNSSADTYVTEGSASIYSQDHATNDGDLYVFGDYTRDSGTEYWNYATDFDGTDLSGGSERQVNVRGASSTVITVDGATLDMRGVSTASTTIDAQSNAFSIIVSSSTLQAEYFEVSNLASDGFGLLSSTTINTLADGVFTVTPGATGMTIDASTIDTNPAAQFLRVDFATTTPGSADNVTLAGAPSSFFWFRDGVQNLYGEAYDANDGNPGSIRWDDSNYQIDISGTVYADDGSTVMGAGTCDGTTAVVRVVVDDNAYTDTTSCDGSGAYNFTNISYIGDPTIVVYLDTNGGERGSVITKTPTADILDLDIYANRVMTRHEDAAPLTISDMVLLDESFDADLRFVVATGSPDTLTVRPDTELIIASSTTFTPEGNITLQSSGSGNTYDGSLHINDSATFIATGNEIHNIGGSFFNDVTSTFVSASSTFNFTATTSGKGITQLSGDTLEFNEIDFSGVGGSWNLSADLEIVGDMNIDAGTVTGNVDITMVEGSLLGNGLLSLGTGTTTILTSTTLGGNQSWTFYDLVLGSGATTSTTTRANSATTTVSNQLVINSAHYLDADSSVWNLTGTGEVFVENGTFIEDTSTVLYSGNGSVDVLATNYYNLQFGGVVGSPVYTLPSTGVLVSNDLTVGGLVSSQVDINTNDTVVSVSGDVIIVDNGNLNLSNSTPLTIFGSYDNNATLTANAGEIIFASTDAYTIEAGNSDFGDVTLNGIGAVTLTENATSTGIFTIASTSDFTQQTGTTLAVGGELQIESATTDWTGTVLSLYGGGDYEMNRKGVTENFDTLVISSDTQVRSWNTDAATEIVDATGSWYSQNHADTNGDLYIFGSYVNDSRNDHWSYAVDFDGTDLSGGAERQVDVYLEDGSTTLWTGGGISVIGTSTASTTIQNQGLGDYSVTIGGNTNTSWRFANIRNINSDGLTFTSSPNVTDLSDLDLLVENNGGSAMTVGGTAITASPARTLSNNIFNSDTGVTGAVNVTATGTTLSGWRFTAHSGNLDGETNDSDPAGDPGYVIWDDSAAIISISGNIYEADGATRSNVCDDTTPNIVLAIAGSLAQQASSSCSSVDGSYTISGISFGSLDELMLYIDGETDRGITVTKDPISSIGDADIYENHVIVRHENTSPLSITDMAVWDSSDDADIPYTAVTGSPDTLSLPADTKLLIWNNKDFEPLGDIAILGGGAGASYDGSLEALSNASFVANGNEEHSIGGSFEFASNADFVAASSTFNFTTSGVGRNISVNNDQFNNLVFNGSGSWSVGDSYITVADNLTITSGDVTLPTGTTTIGGSMVNSGNLNTNNGVLHFVSNDSGESITLGGNDAADVSFAGSGSWTINDSNATITDSFLVATGTVTLPSGVLAVGQDFLVRDTINHNSGTIDLTNSAGETTLTLSGNDLFTLIQSGGATTTMTDPSASLRGDLFVNDGAFVAATNTLSIAGSLDVSLASFETSSGTILFNSDDTGEFIDPGSNEFNNVVIAGVGGGWTLLENATSTNNFTITTGSSFTLSSGKTLYVGGVFTNNLGGTATEWTGSTLALGGDNQYEVSPKTIPAENYETLVLGNNTDISLWNSIATTTVVPVDSSLYSQDHGNNNGDLSIYGEFTISTTSEYWSYGRDFDGTLLTGGSRRGVSVTLVDTAGINVTSNGSLDMVGDSLATTTVQSDGSGQYTFVIDGGNINWNTYSFRDIPFNGIVASSTPSITALSNGDFEIDQDGGTALRLSLETLDANPSLTIPNVRFARVLPANVGVNVRLSATSTNAWRFTSSYGNISGEDFDVDGITECGSVRWDDSSCLLTEQTEYRWRHDDGGIGVPDSEWFDSSFAYRQQVRVVNNDAQLYSDAVVNIKVPYDSDMRSDFGDLRFTTSDGVTLTDYWIEKQSASTEAEIWLVVPSLPASETVRLFMYYGSSTASSLSSDTDVFTVVDNFEDNNISEYNGDTAKFQTNTTIKYGGSYGLKAVTPGDFTNLGLVRFDQTINQGETIRTRLYVDAGVGDTDEQCTLFGVQSPASAHQNYGVCISQFGTERVSIARNTRRNDVYTGVTQLSSQPYNFTTSGWYELEIDWGVDDSIFVSVFNPAGNLIATTSATDSTYSSGGYGFTYWTNNGAWDGFHSRSTIDSKPQVILGNKQQSGGASYAALQNTPTSAFTVGDVARLRVAIENTGLSITDQEYRIEYAAKGVAPSCAAVPAINYSAVPSTGSCGSSAICMATSAFVTNNQATTDLLLVDGNSFVSGEYVEDTSNQTTQQDLNQNNYTELEYALNITVNAADQGYCFRVTDAGAAYDSYQNVPELSLKFDPTIGTINLNQGLDISLLPGTTTAVYATGTVSDLNGFSDLSKATTTVFRSGVAGGASCTPDNNNCYVSTNPNNCQFTNCSGNSCEIECRADIFFHADPTDSGTYSGEDWVAFVEIVDTAGGYAFTSSPSVELETLRAIDVIGTIDYGALAVNSDTGSFNASTSVLNIGNVEADLQITGTDLSDGTSSVIPAEQQKFATSTFNYSGCSTCELLSSSTQVDIDIDLGKPSVDTPPVSDDVFWGIAIPFGINSAPHQGINVFTPVSP